MDIMPKRRKSKDNPYILSKDEANNIYLVSFLDGTNIYRSIRVSKEVYEEMDYFERRDLSQMNEYDNHIEHSKIYENKLNSRLLNTIPSIEEDFINSITISELKKALEQLPELQKNRIIQFYFNNLNTYEIARREGVAHQVVDRNIKKAIINLKKILKNFN